MVFPSIPPYLDPSNWHHQQQTPQIIGSSTTNPLHPPQPGPPGPAHGSGTGPGSVRPGSMAERARHANIPLPEAALKCPRCESANTKFCYFNNYSLSQPRHFCKTCRRYWTRGGALRNVPVGGGCRRNKKSKSNSSKSPASGDRQTNPNSTAGVSNNTATANMLGLTPPQLPPLRFMSPLSHLSENFDIGLNYSGITGPGVAPNEMNFHGSTGLLGGGVAALLSGGGGNIEPWRLQQIQQFPFTMEPSPSSGIYQFHQGGESGLFIGSEMNGLMRPKLSSSITQMTSVKMEENLNPELSMSRQLLGGLQQPAGNEQWNMTTPAWTDLSSFSSSSTSNPL